MNPQASCPECGKTLPDGKNVCPTCLMGQALASRTLADTREDDRCFPDSPAAAEIADKFPQFEIIECLGRGGMGVVYKARQKSLDRWVAIKILPPSQARDAAFAARFEKEARTLAKMSHPNIVTVFDHGETDELFYIVMEYVDGVNLRDLMREGKMEPEQALAIVPPVCEALEYAHDKGVVHRDIKPENLLLDRDGRVKIADFGIASIVGAEGERSGTPAYMAPEQSAGVVDRRGDIYALGAVLYEMLTGERPGEDLVAPSQRVEVDVKIDEMVLRALEKEPERRYQTAGEFRTVAQTVASGWDRGGVQARERLVNLHGSAGSTPSGRGRWKFGVLFAVVLIGAIAGPRLVQDHLTRRAGPAINTELARDTLTPVLQQKHSLRWEAMHFEPNPVSPSEVIVRFTDLKRVGMADGQAEATPLEGILNLRTLDGVQWRADGLQDLLGLQFYFSLGDSPGGIGAVSQREPLVRGRVQDIKGDSGTSAHGSGSLMMLGLGFAGLLVVGGCVVVIVLLAVRAKEAASGLSWGSLGLMVVAVLGLPVLMVLGSPLLVLLFSGGAALFSLGFAIAAWRTKMARVVIGVWTLLLGGGLVYSIAYPALVVKPRDEARVRAMAYEVRQQRELARDRAERRVGTFEGIYRAEVDGQSIEWRIVRQAGRYHWLESPQDQVDEHNRLEEEDGHLHAEDAAERFRFTPAGGGLRFEMWRKSSGEQVADLVLERVEQTEQRVETTTPPLAPTVEAGGTRSVWGFGHLLIVVLGLVGLAVAAGYLVLAIVLIRRAPAAANALSYCALGVTVLMLLGVPLLLLLGIGVTWLWVLVPGIGGIPVSLGLGIASWNTGLGRGVVCFWPPVIFLGLLFVLFA